MTLNHMLHIGDKNFTLKFLSQEIWMKEWLLELLKTLSKQWKSTLKFWEDKKSQQSDQFSFQLLKFLLSNKPFIPKKKLTVQLLFIINMKLSKSEPKFFKTLLKLLSKSQLLIIWELKNNWATLSCLCQMIIEES